MRKDGCRPPDDRGEYSVHRAPAGPGGVSPMNPFLHSSTRWLAAACVRPPRTSAGRSPAGSSRWLQRSGLQRACWVVASCLLGTAVAPAAERPVIPLPPPNQSGGKPLMAALKERQSTREFSARPLPLQMLADLLWAGFGINRPESDHRTAPSTMNMQEIDLYIALADGLYLYEAKPHQLRLIENGDLRPKTGGKAALQEAPAIVILVADFSRMTKAKPQDRDFYAAIDTGFISQNLYLFCASAGLATVVHELERPPLARAMNLRPEQRIMIAQSVGYPKK
jgi:nitroreductase